LLLFIFHYNYIVKYYLATDLDGTLLYPKRPYSLLAKSNKKFLERFLSEGNEVIFVSGRNTKVPRQLSKKLNHDIPTIACNGSYIYENGKVKNSKPVPNELAMKLFLKHQFNYGIVAWFIFDDTERIHVCLKKDNPLYNAFFKFGNSFRMNLAEKMVMGEKNFINVLQFNKIYKLMPVFGVGRKGTNNAFYAYHSLNDQYSSELEIFWSKQAIEISAKGTSKGNALMDYVKQNNISLDSVLVAGDSGNDTTLFNQFKHSFCMANAASIIKAQANHIVSRVSEIEKYIKNPDLMKEDKLEK